MKRKYLSVMSVLIVMSMFISVFAGCSSSSSTTSTSEPATESSTASTETSSTAESSTPVSATDGIVIYTNSGSNGRAEWITEYAKEAGHNITVVHIQGGDLANRIIAEKNNQTADMVFGLNAMEYERLKREDVLEAFKPAWAGEVDSSLGDADGFYYPIVVQPLVMAYNTDTYTPETAPKSYADLATKEEFADKYTILKLGGGTAKSVISSLLIQYRDDSTETGISEEGWAFMEKWIQNGYIEPEDYDFFQDLIDGKRPVCMLYGSGFIQKGEEYGATNIDFMVPETGVPFVVEQVAVFKNAKNPEGAKAFIDWFGTSEVQAAWSAKFGTIPAQPAAVETASEPVKAMMSKVKAQPMDWKFISEHIEQWMEKIELEFVE